MIHNFWMVNFESNQCSYLRRPNSIAIVAVAELMVTQASPYLCSLGFSFIFSVLVISLELVILIKKYQKRAQSYFFRSLVVVILIPLLWGPYLVVYHLCLFCFLKMFQKHSFRQNLSKNSFGLNFRLMEIYSLCFQPNQCLAFARLEIYYLIYFVQAIGPLLQVPDIVKILTFVLY